VFFYLTVVLLCVFPNEAEFEAEDVHVHVSVRSNIYTYTVTNLGTSPIIAFEVREHSAYNFIAPEDWDKEFSGGVARARAGNTEVAIRPGEAADFSLRLSSKGAVLGYAPAKVHFQSGKTVTISGVWATVPEPRGYVGWVSAIVLIILLLHTTVLVYKDRRRQKAFVSEP